MKRYETLSNSDLATFLEMITMTEIKSDVIDMVRMRNNYAMLVCVSSVFNKRVNESIRQTEYCSRRSSFIHSMTSFLHSCRPKRYKEACNISIRLTVRFFNHFAFGVPCVTKLIISVKRTIKRHTFTQRCL